MPALLLPAALAALAALVVPFVVHLVRRHALRPVAFAALRWLEPRRRPRAQWRFDEWPLLITRLILLALVVLGLARPVLFGTARPVAWVAVAPGIDPATAPAGGERHWLAPGFPALDRPPPAGPVAFASLVRQLDAELPPGTTLTLVVPTVIAGADAELLHLSHRVDWRIAVGRPAQPADAPPPPRLTVRYAPARAAAVRYLRAAAIAWQPPGHAIAFDAAPADRLLPPAPGVVVWLGGALPAAVTDWVRHGGTALVEGGVGPDDAVVWRDPIGTALATSTLLGRGRLLHLARPLDPAALPALLDPGFPAQLRTLLVPPPAPTRVAAADYAPLPGGAIYPQPARDLAPWLALLVAATLLVERWLATGRRRGAA
jgi:hypothetical protein